MSETAPPGTERRGIDRRGPLPAQDARPALLRAPEDEGHFPAGTVEVRLHDLQRERAGDGGVESVAAALEGTHCHRSGEPVGRGSDTEGAFDLGTSRERQAPAGGHLRTAWASAANFIATSKSSSR